MIAKLIFVALLGFTQVVTLSNPYVNTEQIQSVHCKKIPGSIIAIENFLNWYKKNYPVISKIRMVDNVIDENLNDVFYRVDFEKTEEYLATMKSSGYISEKYIQKWRDYFVKRDEKFKKINQNGGPPSGFEFDFVLWTQEIDETLDAIDNIRFTSINETTKTSVVEVDIIMNLRFSLTKNNDVWQIDDIENI